MKDIKIIIDGKEITATIDDSVRQQILSPVKKTGYERVEDNAHYYYVDYDGQVELELEDGHYIDKTAYTIANYYSDKTVAENNARADKLMRQLRRFAVEHREKALDWIDTRNTPWVFVIQGDPETKRLSVHKIPCGLKRFGTIYFDSEENAKLAIDTYRDELLWYFTEYKDSL